MKDTDQTIDLDALARTHERIVERGWAAALEDLAEHEPALVAYLLATNVLLVRTLSRNGASARTVGRVERQYLTRMLTCIESVRAAHRELWRDLIPDDNQPKVKGEHADE